MNILNTCSSNTDLSSHISDTSKEVGNIVRSNSDESCEKNAQSNSGLFISNRSIANLASGTVIRDIFSQVPNSSEAQIQRRTEFHAHFIEEKSDGVTKNEVLISIGSSRISVSDVGNQVCFFVQFQSSYVKLDTKTKFSDR